MFVTIPLLCVLFLMFQAKRLRVHRGGQLASSVVSPSGKSEVPSIEGDDDGEEKYCLGCKRSNTTGQCYIVPDEQITWAFFKNGKPRGKWCRDCYTVWRTNFLQTHSLTLFGKWLRQAPSNQESFEWMLIASLTLRAENVEKITGAMVLQRVDCIKMALRLLGQQCVPSMVLNFVDACSSPELRKALNPQGLVNLNIDGKSSVGIVVPRPFDAPGKLLPRPTGAQGLLSRPLFSSSSADEKLLHELWGDGSRAEPAFSLASASRAIVPFKLSLSKLHSKMVFLATSFRQCLDVFQHQDWAEKLKESAFTTPLAKFIGLEVEARGAEKADLVKTCHNMVEGISATKSFAKHHRDYMKSLHKHGRLSAWLLL